MAVGYRAPLPLWSLGVVTVPVGTPTVGYAGLLAFWLGAGTGIEGGAGGAGTYVQIHHHFHVHGLLLALWYALRSWT